MGMDGAGHSAWCEPAEVQLPGPAPLLEGPAAAAPSGQDGAEPNEAPRKRRARRAAAERELSLADPKLSASLCPPN